MNYKEILQKDKVLKQISNEIKLPEIKSTQNVFHDLMSCIIEQQIHYRSTKKTFQKALQSSEIEILSIDNFSVFEEKGLQHLKLSMNKYETILRTIEFFQKNSIHWQKLSSEEVKINLKKIKGIGNWTMDMILLYTLEKPDVFPVDDYHIKQLMPMLYKVDTTAKVNAQLKEIALNWSPFRSYGFRYLLAWKKHTKKK